LNGTLILKQNGIFQHEEEQNGNKLRLEQAWLNAAVIKDQKEAGKGGYVN
jgi:hypothetical protein